MSKLGFSVVSLVLVCLRTAIAFAGPIEMPLLWEMETNTFLESAPGIADMNGDGHVGIVMAGREEIIALNGAGKELWRYRTPGRLMTYPAVWERGGQPALIYAADSGGTMICVDGAGKKAWDAKLKAASSWSASVLGDLDGNGLMTVVQTDESGAVWAFDALSGHVRWQAAVQGSPVSPALGDLDGDGKLEVVLTSGTGKLFVLNSDGTPRWDTEVGGDSATWSTSAPVIFAASDGSVRVLAASSDGKLFCLSCDGQVLWRQDLRGPAASGISVGDMDRDGIADLFVTTQTGNLFRFNENGAALWDTDIQGRCLAAGALVQFGAIKALTFILSTQSGNLLAFDNNGNKLFDHQFDNRTINCTPAFGDISPEAPGLEMVLTGGESGRVFCFKTPASNDALIDWGQYRGDVQRTGAWFGLTHHDTAQMIACNLAWNEIGTSGEILFSIANPNADGKPLFAEASCHRPDGARVTATTKVLGTKGTLRLLINGVMSGPYTFAWSLRDVDGNVLTTDSKTLYLVPFETERAEVSRALQEAAAISESITSPSPSIANALRTEIQRIASLSDKLHVAQQQVGAMDGVAARDVLNRTRSLLDDAKRISRFSQLVKDGKAPSLIAFEGVLWDSRNVDRQLPVRVESSLTIRRRALPGAHEPVSLALFNPTDHELTVRLRADNLPAGCTLVAHRSEAVPTSLGDHSWDPLPELDMTRTLTVPSLATRELWLDFVLDETAKGNFRFPITLQALNGSGVVGTNTSPGAIAPPETRIDIALEVIPFALAPSGAFRLCMWATLGEKEIADLLAHGANVFVVPLGQPIHDKEGHLVDVDFSQADKIIHLLHGHDVVLLPNGIPALKADPTTPQYQADFATWLGKTAAHLAEQGFDKKHFALYPVDEPGGLGWNAVNQVVTFGKLVKAIDKDILIYVDGGGEKPMMEAMAPYVDVWVPAIPMLAESSPEMDVIRKDGGWLWSYNCGYGFARPVGANLKNINILAEYRMAAEFALSYGATGIGFWSYNIGEDMWGRAGLEYPVVYGGANGPVTSRRWEAIRESIEDARLMIALRDKAHIAEDSIPESARTAIEQATASLNQWMGQSYEEGRIGLGRDAIDATNNEAALQEWRERLLDAAQALAAR